MEFLVLLSFFILLGAIFGWIAFFSNRRLSKRLEELQQELKQLSAGQVTESSQEQPAYSTPTTQSALKTGPGKKETLPEPDSIHTSSQGIPAAPVTSETDSSRSRPDWIDNLRHNWMVWLGGICVGLSGIFLTKYSIDQGYLGPTARIVAGIILGLVIHAAAEWFRRKKGPHPSFAALAAGGSITLFAALLTALHIFHLINPTLVFILLAIVALITMTLALLHGPVLAIIGILGAYLVPLMVSDGPGGAMTVLIYALIISGSALLLMRYIYRHWLWLGVLAGGLGWWLLTLMESDINGLRGIYLTCFSCLLITILSTDWSLNGARNSPATVQGIKKYFTSTSKLEGLLPMGLLFVLMAQCISVAMHGLSGSPLVNWSPLAILLLFAGGRRQYLSLHPWLLLILSLAAWLAHQYDLSDLVALDSTETVTFYWYCTISAVIYAMLSIYNFLESDDKALWLSLAVLAPLLFLTLAYVLSGRPDASLNWSMIAAVFGVLYLFLAGTIIKKQGRGIIPAWLIIGGHLAYSLAVAMYLREASLTLALAVQIVSLASIVRRFETKSIGWLLKVIVALVIFRLTLNPWLLTYPTDVHWSLWTYGGATLCCFAGGLLLQNWPSLRKWTYGATVHLFAITLWAETRYWLYDGNVYAAKYQFMEAVLLLNIFWMLGLVYHYRERFSSYLARLYRFYSLILISMALLNYFIIILATITSQSWVWRHISDTRVFNLMLLAYGTPVLLGLLTRRFYLPRFAKAATIFTGAAFFIFITLEIRHLWHGQLRLSVPSTDAELYTYSAVWLLMAVLAIIGGVWRFGEGAYHAGMLLLVIVIAKLFLVDMSDLEGLLRVASFMGMGLGLLGIAYLHQRLNRNI